MAFFVDWCFAQQKRRPINNFYVGIRRNHTRILAHSHHRDKSTQQPWQQSKPPSRCYSGDMLHPINAIQLQNHRASPPCHHGSVAQIGDSIGIRRETPTSTRTTNEFSSISSAFFDHRLLGPFNLPFLGVIKENSMVKCEGEQSILQCRCHPIALSSWRERHKEQVAQTPTMQW